MTAANALPMVTGLVPRYLLMAQSRAVDDAVGLVLDELEDGRSPADLIRSLLAPAQAEAGDRWHRATWTIAHEHQVTAVTDAALHRVVSLVRPRTYRAALAVVCAEGDWHTLPSRMAAELLRFDGWRVTFLGGSLPGPDLDRWLREFRPDAIIVSCSIATFAPGVRAVAAVATRLGIPVVAGGRGMGRDGARAAALSAGWTDDLGSLAAALATVTHAPDRAELRRRWGVHDAVTLQRSEIVAAAMRQLTVEWPPMSQLTAWQLARTREDFGHILDFLIADHVLADPQVFAEFLDWLTLLLVARNIPATVVPRSLRALAAAIPPELGLVRGTLTAAIDTRSATAIDSRSAAVS